MPKAAQAEVVQLHGLTIPTSDKARRGKAQRIPLKYLFSDPIYNRPLNEARVEEMANEFDPDALGVLLVSKRSEERYAIIDGQHRVALLHTIEWSDYEPECYVLTNLSVEREAQIYTTLNLKRARPLPIEIFKAQLAAKNPEAVAIQDLLATRGLVITTNPSPNSVRAVGAVERIYKLGSPELLLRTLDACLAWPEDVGYQRFGAEILQGVALLLAFHGRAIKDDQLQRTLQRSLPRVLVQQAKVRQAAGERIGGTLAGVLAEKYNQRLAVSNRIALVPATQLANAFRFPSEGERIKGMVA